MSNVVVSGSVLPSLDVLSTTERQAVDQALNSLSSGDETRLKQLFVQDGSGVLYSMPVGSGNLRMVVRRSNEKNGKYEVVDIYRREVLRNYAS